jgi:TolB-like protein/Tfp pilus assembly protein PilF
MPLISELKRRNVLRMAALYLVTAWLALQVVDVLGAILIWPLWTNQLVLAVLAVGFPIALVISWFYEVTPAGVRREEDVPTAAAIHPHGRTVDFVIISVLCAAVLVFAYDKWWPQAPIDRSIAVLPFQNLSGYPEQEYFSDGIAEETLNLLADINAFKVIAWTTARMYRDRAVDIVTVASELNVSHVLEGSVRKSGDRVRVMAQLIDGADNSHVWSQAYEREVTAENLFEIQQEIATAIAGRLSASLTKEERGRLETVPTHNLEAYDAYLLGRQGIARATTASLLEAAEHLREAIELDPTFAEAHAALARAYWIYFGRAGDKEMPGVTDDDYEKLIERALELDPDNGLAHAMHGRWLAYRGAPGEEAEAELQKGIELSPNDPEVYLIYGEFVQGRERKLDLYMKGLEVDPMSPRLNGALGFLMFTLGRPDEAVFYYKRAIETDPDSTDGHANLTFIHWWFTGRMDEAMRWAHDAYSKDPESPAIISWIGWTYLWLNDDVAAERWFRHAISLAPKSGWGELGMIDVYHVRGLHDEEWELLGQYPWAWDRAMTHLIADQRYEEARDRLMSDYPDLFDKNPEDASEYESAVGLELRERLQKNILAARILTGLGDPDRAARLLAAAEKYVATRLRSDPWDYGGYAWLYAALGRDDEAIEAWRKCIEGGAYGFWQLDAADSVFDSIRDRPEFQQILDDIAAEMAIQLERVREMERNGEIPMLPEAS